MYPHRLTATVRCKYRFRKHTHLPKKQKKGMLLSLYENDGGITMRKTKKIIGYLCVAAVSITVVIITKDVFATLLIALGGFYCISNDVFKL